MSEHRDLVLESQGFRATRSSAGKKRGLPEEPCAIGNAEISMLR